MRGAVPATQLPGTQVYAIAKGTPCAALGAEMQQHAVPLFHSPAARGARLVKAKPTRGRWREAFDLFKSRGGESVLNILNNLNSGRLLHVATLQLHET